MKVSLSNLQSEISALRVQLREAEKSLSLIPKMEGNDVFHKVIPKGIRKCKSEFSDLESLLEETVKEFQKTADLFGENGKMIQPDQFFQNVSAFMESFQVTCFFLS